MGGIFRDFKAFLGPAPVFMASAVASHTYAFRFLWQLFLLICLAINGNQKHFYLTLTMIDMRPILFILFILIGIQGIGQQPKLKACLALQRYTTRFDTTQSRGLADNYFLWDAGSVISVKILSGSARYRNLVVQAAREWEKYANIQFRFIDKGPSHVRILLADKGNTSEVGLQALNIPEPDPTCYMDTLAMNNAYFLSYAMHEFGHILGLLHEHKHPANTIKWDKEAIYNSIKNEYGCWSGRSMPDLDELYFRPYHTSYANGSSYDPASIMHYPVPASWTKNKQQFKWNLQLSDGDRALISHLYPRRQPRPETVPRVTVKSSGFRFVVDKAQSIYRVQPLMELDASTSGTMYLLFYFANEDGEWIADEGDQQFAIDGVAGVFKKFQLPKGSFTTQDPAFDFSIPFNQLALPKNRKIYAYGMLLYENAETREFKTLYRTPALVLLGEKQ